MGVVNKHGAQHEQLGNLRTPDLAGFVDLFAGQAKIGGGFRKKVAENGQCFSAHYDCLAKLSRADSGLI